MKTEDRNSLKRAVLGAMAYWPNAHLGDYTRREDLRSAFRFIRYRVEGGAKLADAIFDLERDIDRYADM